MHRINILIREKSNVSVMRTQAITHRRPRDEKCYLAKKDLRIQALQANSEASAPVSSCSGTVVEKFDGRATDDLFEEVDGDRTPTSKDFERQSTTWRGCSSMAWLPALISPDRRD